LGRDLVRADIEWNPLAGISLVSTAISLAIGVTWGAVAGYVAGAPDELMMRSSILYSLPYLFIVIILTTVFERGAYGVVLRDRAVGGSLLRAS